MITSIKCNNAWVGIMTRLTNHVEINLHKVGNFCVGSWDPLYTVVQQTKI